MKYIAILLFITFVALPSYSQTGFTNIGSITIDYEKVSEKLPLASNELRTANKKVIGKYYSFDVKDIIEPFLKNIKNEDRKRLIIIAINKKGENIPFTYYDVDPKSSPLPAMVVYEPVTGSIGDTVKVLDIEGAEGMVDLDKVLDESRIAVKRRLYLQAPSITAKEKELYFSKPSLVFPVDKTTGRWLDDVIRIDFYIKEKEQ